MVRNQLLRNRIEPHTGHGRFIDEYTVLVENPNHAEHITVMTLGAQRGEYRCVFDSDDPAPY